MSKKVKVVKKNLAPAAKPLGVNPSDPWSAKAGITEASEKELLHRFLDSRGINPEFVSKETKIAHSKSGEYLKWKKDHEFGEQIVYEATDKEDVLSFDIPLFIRILELAREDVKEDMELHRITERLLSIRKQGVLTMDDYDFIAGLKKLKEQWINEGLYVDHEEIAKHLVKRKGANVNANDIHHASILHKDAHKVSTDLVRRHVLHLLGKGPNPSNVPQHEGTSALERFRQAAAQREKKHDDIEKKRQADAAQGKENMSGAIDRLDKMLNRESVLNPHSPHTDYKEKSKTLHQLSLNKDVDQAHVTQRKLDLDKEYAKIKKENVEQISEITKSDYISAVRKTKDPNFSDDESGPGYKSGRERIINRAEKHQGKKFADKLRKDNYWREFGLHKGVRKGMKKYGNDGKSHPITKDTYKEENELNEMDQKFVDSLNKLSQTHKVGDSVTVNSKFFGKQKGKVTKVDKQSVHVVRDGKSSAEKYPHDAVVKEDVYQDSYAATQTVFDGGNNTDDTSLNRKREMSKSARMIKALYKKHRMVKEDMYDHEKEDKSVQTYGKKPKTLKTDEKSSMGENKPDAAAIVSGGTTLTGEKRDDVEIDPMMKNRPSGQNQFNKEFGKKGS
jgi:hypothetical protein